MGFSVGERVKWIPLPPGSPPPQANATVTRVVETDHGPTVYVLRDGDSVGFPCNPPSVWLDME